MSLDNVKNILLVLSGKGGVGKSSITTQLALSLSLSGKTVGILDIDLTGPSIPRLLGLEDAKITQAAGGWKPVQVHPAQTLPPLPAHFHPPSNPRPSSISSAIPPESAQRNGSSTPPQTPPSQSKNNVQIGALHAASLAFLLPSRGSAVIWRGPKKTAMVRQFLTDVSWPPLDYLLIDTPPGTSDEHISLAETLLKTLGESSTPTPTQNNKIYNSSGQRRNKLAGAVIVTTPQAVATSDVKKEINFCRKTSIPIVGVVENMSGYVCECCGERTNLFGKGGGEVMSKEFGIRFLGGVPVDLGWGVVVEEGGWGSYGGRKEGEREGNDGERGESGEKAGEERLEDDGRARRKSDALLVRRYRSCKLCEVFEGISKQIVQIVEG